MNSSKAPTPNATTQPPSLTLPVKSGAVKAPMRQVMRHWWSIGPERPGQEWQYVLATAAYNTAIGLVLTVFFTLLNPTLSPVRIFFETLLYSQCIGFCIHLGFWGFYTFTNPSWRDGLPRATLTGIHVGIPVIGVYMGYTVAFALNGKSFLLVLQRFPRLGFTILFVGLVVSFVWYLIMQGQTARLRAEADRALAQANVATAQKQASDAELRALQAQIEPHFLFNTLANVQALIDYEPAKAKKMLETFNDYLRATLDASRRTHATLGDEIAMLERYLQLMQVRMGPRLSFEIDVASALRTHPFAPLLLQPLVENAIKYGLEPKIKGGSIAIRAAEHDGRISVEVIDDGVGQHTMSSAQKATSPGSGAGMANVLARLQSNFGPNATLTIQDLAVGCCARLSFDARA